MAHKAPTNGYLACQKKFVNFSTKPFLSLKLEIIITYFFSHHIYQCVDT